jgi:hypothetical protein
MRTKNAEQQSLNFDMPRTANIEQITCLAADPVFDSDEEKYFSWYLDELLQAGYISRWTYQPYTYRLSPIQKYSVYQQMKTGTKTKRLSLLRAHEYTPDFGIQWTEKASRIFFNGIFHGIDLKTAPFIINYDTIHNKAILYSVIEIKPSFDRNNMIRLFRINQKWLYDLQGVYVQEITVDKKNGRGLFPDSFTPNEYRLTEKTKQERSLKYEPRSLKEFIDLP